MFVHSAPIAFLTKMGLYSLCGPSQDFLYFYQSCLAHYEDLR